MGTSRVRSKTISDFNIDDDGIWIICSKLAVLMAIRYTSSSNSLCSAEGPIHAWIHTLDCYGHSFVFPPS